jgi:heat shock protein HslJ
LGLLRPLQGKAGCNELSGASLQKGNKLAQCTLVISELEAKPPSQDQILIQFTQ